MDINVNCQQDCLEICGSRERELTGGLCARQRLALHTVGHGIHMDQILCLWHQSGQSEVVPSWGQPLILCTPTACLLIVDPVSSNGGSWRCPASREGVRVNFREGQAGGGVQSCQRQVE